MVGRLTREVWGKRRRRCPSSSGEASTGELQEGGHAIPALAGLISLILMDRE